MSGGFGFSQQKSSSKPSDLKDPFLAAPNQQFASVLAGLLGATGPQTGTVRGSGPNATATVTPALNPLAGIPTWTGQFAAGIAPGEQAALAGLDATGGARNAYLGKSLQGGFLNGNPFGDQLLDQGMRKISEHYEQTLGRTLPGQFTKAGHRVQPGQSSPFDHAAALESRGFANALGDFASNFQAQRYEGERNRQQQSAQLSQQEVEAGVQKLQAHALPRLIQDLGIQRGLQEFQNRSERLLQLLQTMMGVSQPALASTSKSSGMGVSVEAQAE